MEASRKHWILWLALQATYCELLDMDARNQTLEEQYVFWSTESSLQPSNGDVFKEPILLASTNKGFVCF